MKDKQTSWERLADLAKAGRPALPESAPFGFATRIIARWKDGYQPSSVPLWEWFSIRTVAVATAIMLATLFVNYDLLTQGWNLNVTIADGITGPLL